MAFLSDISAHGDKYTTWFDMAYFSSDEWQDVHLPRLALLDGGDDETGAAQDDLPPGPAVHRQLELPFPNIISARQLDPLRALDALGLPCKKEGKNVFNYGSESSEDPLWSANSNQTLL